MSRVEVLCGPERRRRWSLAEKRSIVADAFAPGASVSAVARLRDVVPGQIYRWQNELRSVVPGLAAVEIEFGPTVRVRIAATAPQDLAAAIVKTLVPR